MARPDDECKETVFSEHDIATFQMIEAVPEKTKETNRSQAQIPDMSVGWYASEAPAEHGASNRQ